MPTDREKAKRVILEILNQAPGGLKKTLVYLAFWLAHVYYSKNEAGFLSGWPVVNLPQGPGIDKGDRLLAELTEAGYLTQEHEEDGPYTQIRCERTMKPLSDALPKNAIAAIREAVAFVKSRTAAEMSQWSHDNSRSWNQTRPDQEMDIYTDLIPDDVYEERQEQLKEMSEALGAFKDTRRGAANDHSASAQRLHAGAESRSDR